MNSPEYKREYALKNKERIKQKKRQNYLDNKEAHLAKMKLYRETSDFDFKGYAIKYKEQNKDKLADYRKEYKSLNKDKVNANNAKRRASRISRTPQWLCDNHKSLIVSIYSEAKTRTNSTGIKHHVDHIVPLQGKTVSGLHVPWNLQVLSEQQNIQKSNATWPDSW
jgi:5-methylcytosine-specific restriction endonuclease McrA